MPTSTAGAHDEEASVQLEQDGKKWKAEFERLAREKQGATLQQDDLQRRLKDAEGEMARAQRPHAKELDHATELCKLSDQRFKAADLAGYARAICEINRPGRNSSFNTPSPNIKPAPGRWALDIPACSPPVPAGSSAHGLGPFHLSPRELSLQDAGKL